MTIDLKTLENLSISPEDKEKIVAEANEQYSKLQSATTKGVATMNKAIEFNNTVDGDVEKIKNFQESDPEAAKIRLDKFHSGETLEEVIAKGNPFEARVNEVVEKKEVDNIIDSYLTQIPENLREQFVSEMNELSGGKKPTLKNVDKIIKATLGVLSPEMDKNVETMAKIAAVSAGGNKSGNGAATIQAQKTAWEDKLKNQSNEFLKNAGIL